MIKRKRFSLSTTQIIILSFLVVIFLGSLLLSLPISSADGKPVPYIDALFTATTSTCVTGLVTLPTATTWSTFGHVVILLLIQAGGLGIITVMSGFMLILHKKMGISDRLLIQDAFNLNTLSGLTRFVKNIFFGTLVVEGVGAMLYMTVFVPEFGAGGIWISVFNSISAFCNAGIDIIGSNSLMDYATNPVVNFTTIFLIVLGGLGYIVWWDVLRVLKNRRSRNLRAFPFLTLHSKIAITATICLILSGAVLILLFEYNNPLTIGNMNLFDKIQVSLFQSVTTRTAGFASVAQENLTTPTVLVCLILMIIGGSPVGTAGGVKTVTLVVILRSAFATVRNKQSATIFGRTISTESIRKAVGVVTIFGIIMITSTICLSAVTDADAMAVLYETVSATATVGLSQNLTSALNVWGKIIIIITMYLGRIGPITLAIALGSKNHSQNIISEPTEDISIG